MPLYQHLQLPLLPLPPSGKCFLAASRLWSARRIRDWESLLPSNRSILEPFTNDPLRFIRPPPLRRLPALSSSECPDISFNNNTVSAGSRLSPLPLLYLPRSDCEPPKLTLLFVPFNIDRTNSFSLNDLDRNEVGVRRGDTLVFLDISFIPSNEFSLLSGFGNGAMKTFRDVLPTVSPDPLLFILRLLFVTSWRR